MSPRLAGTESFTAGHCVSIGRNPNSLPWSYGRGFKFAIAPATPLTAIRQLQWFGTSTHSEGHKKAGAGWLQP